MNPEAPARSIQILLVEDNPGDVELTQESLKDSKVANHLTVIGDGEDALAFLRRQDRFADAPRPDVILLDLNLPRLSGREVLSAIKNDPSLRSIPVVILTTSNAEEDILRAYELNANCYVTKPVSLDQFVHIVQAIDNFWFNIVSLPRKA